MAAEGVPRALLTLSMKGGVGKTTTAIGLVKAPQRRGHKVGLLAVDIHGSTPPLGTPALKAVQQFLQHSAFQALAPAFGDAAR